jgi:asparagine synthase (glutamine-hydrolysing)
VAGTGKVAVAYSGGLDSSVLVLCARRRTEVVACSAFAGGALDERNSRRGAEELGVGLATTRLTGEMVAGEAERVALPFPASLMDRSLWCLYSAVARSASEQGAGTLILGQLADELFGGYAKYETALRETGEGAAESMMRRDLAEYVARGRVRDVAACSPWAKAVLPFEAPRIVELGLSLPVSYKIREGVRKAVLRRAAVIMGLPEGLASVPKKAAQYSSGIQKIVVGARSNRAADAGGGSGF